jgi:hypothetical protein
MTEAKISKEDLYQRLSDEWDFEQLLEPYREGGTPSNPVRRTWGTMIDWLINKRKFPPDVVGAGIFLAWMKIKKDGHFPPDIDPKDPKRVIYGSAGDKFAKGVAAICGSIMQQKMSQQIFSGMAGKVEQQIKDSFNQDFWDLTPWFVKMFSIKYWKHRTRIKQARKAKNG